MRRIKDLRTRGGGIRQLQLDASIAEAVREFIATGAGALVVCDGTELAGIITGNDVIRCVRDHPDGIRGIEVRDYMTTDVFTTTIDANLDDVMKVMVEKGFHHVPVLDGGEVVGIVTAADILVHQRTHLGRERDELIRYIQGSYR